MSNETEQELSGLRRKVAEAEKKAAVADARREQAKADLKAALKKAADEYGVKTLAELEAKVDELRTKRDAAMNDLREAVRDL